MAKEIKKTSEVNPELEVEVKALDLLLDEMEEHGREAIKPQMPSEKPRIVRRKLKIK